MVRDEARRVLPSGEKEGIMSIEEASGYAVVVLVLLACFVGIVATLDSALQESPIRRWRKMHTPPCRLCANHAAKSDPDFARIVWDACRCRRAIDRSERLDGAHADWLLCKEVRGTRYCAFEPKGDEE